MKRRIKMFLIFACIVATSKVFGAYLINVPQKITQPNGKVVNCFATGDEYYNWLHDKDNYTIIRDSKTGDYCYAIIQNNELIASKLVVGVDNPFTSGLAPGINLTADQVLGIGSSYLLNTPEPPILVSKSNQTLLKSATTIQTLNNIVIYVRFADQAEFPASQTTYSSMFNSATSGSNSMYNYFREASYNNLNVVSSFYPTNNGVQIMSYRDCHIRDYYRPFSASNDSGYINSFADYQQIKREQRLLGNAINFVNSQISTSLNVDYNGDGYVDNVCLILRGGYETNNISLWPHKDTYWSIYPIVTINSKPVSNYNIQIEEMCIDDNYGVYALSHEFFHTLGAPDLYHSTNNGIKPVGQWDLMYWAPNPPQSMGAFMKFKYGHWISSIPEITQSGNYSLNPVTSPSNNCYLIRTTATTDEYFVVEFRQKTGTFESSIPGTGLLIYRINGSMPLCGPDCCKGNYNGPPDEVYVYRPNGTLTIDGDVANANYSSMVGRTTFSNTSNPNCFLKDGALGNVFIKNIVVSGNEVSFDVRFCDGTDKIIANTNQLPPVTNASNTIVTSGTVTVKSTDNITFEASQGITLNGGFEVQLGGQFTINMNGCGGTQ